MANLIQRLALRAFDIFGYVIIPKWRLANHAQVSYLKKLFGYYKIDCVFDVGANEGQYAHFLRSQVGYKGLIVSFEPIPVCAELLRNFSTRDEMWLIEEVALGLEDKSARFNVMASTQFSSFLNPDSSHTQIFTQQNRRTNEIVVQVKTLNEYVPKILRDYGCRSPYLKLDTQGYDLNVARGAGDFIRYFRAIQSEVSVVPIYNDMPSYIQSIDEFKKMGFDLSAVFPNNPDHFPRAIEFDFHMVNREFA